jgi:two-component sensor histidine kinase
MSGMTMREADCGDSVPEGEKIQGLRRELEDRVRNNLSVMLALVKLQAANPPVSAAMALARVAGQIVTLAAIYDESIETQKDGLVELRGWCKRIIDAVARGLAKSGTIVLTGENREINVPLDRAQTIGLTLGELLADASERARKTGHETRIEVELCQTGPSRLALRIRDEAPSEALPPVAIMLAREFGGRLANLGSDGHSEREFLFDAAIS